ncbi:MFS transporter [Sphingomonas sp. Leaf412]|uniref:multidrug effflux MFS transporter n=1 Tax=Sphingomonas sp. Leaf412 TaxID=1736370 RepID=UPI0006F5E184|nr:multidrug effflux MFS transporter [Sphingomonas sp. Leaf412]KQT32779.1 MFS transporter [Sphingomonas sp. Leaf412]
MADRDTPLPAGHGAPLALPEFVALVAALMALGALGIDSMLPALPAIGSALGTADANANQYVITAFFAGFGAGQLIHGPLADRYGRRRVLIVALAIYAVANALCAVAASFPLLLAARLMGGLAVAATRVATVAMVRDCFHGRAMARVMSIVMMVFMIVPVLAPAFGAAVLVFGGWRDIFWAIVATAGIVLAWFAWRMPETLHAGDRLPMSLSRILAGWRTTVTDRRSLGYTLATAVLLGALYGYLNSVQQIMAQTFARADLLVVIFGATASTMAVANLFNARLVMRLGMRRLGHGAVAAMLVASIVHLAIAASGHESLLTFAILQAVTMASFGLSTANFSAMAMEDMGHIAGVASSVQGFLSISIAVGIGAVVGQAFDGTTLPLATGFVVASGLALLIVASTERGRLFAAT